LKTENDVGGVPPQSIQENSLKKKNASVARKGLMHFCFVRSNRQTHSREAL